MSEPAQQQTQGPEAREEKEMLDIRTLKEMKSADLTKIAVELNVDRQRLAGMDSPLVAHARVTIGAVQRAAAADRHPHQRRLSKNGSPKNSRVRR